MRLAHRNVFGVDLKPIAVELAEVLLWLNVIYGETDLGADGRPLPANREEWWLEVGAILEGAIIDLTPQNSLDLVFSEPSVAKKPGGVELIFGKLQPAFEGFEPNQ